MTRTRLDVALVDRGLVDSREQARRLILAGVVRMNGEPARKASSPVAEDARLEVEAPPPFVGRGGEKLEAAFQSFPLDVQGLVCLDIGASTGGFTDCMLQHGAARVYAIDVGRGQLHWKMRSDPRVVPMDGVNARYLEPGSFPESADFAAVDVSFISLTKILPAVTNILRSGASLVTLIKPQFEAGRADVARGGVVRDAGVRSRVVQTIREHGESVIGLIWNGVVESPLRGPAGNVEFLACWRKS